MINSLTQKQKEVLHLCAQGLRNAQICDILKIEPSTLRTHLANIYLELEVYRTEQPRLKSVLLYLSSIKQLKRNWIKKVKRSFYDGSYEPYPIQTTERRGRSKRT